jgi:CheY-like chemotaxis protein
VAGRRDACENAYEVSDLVIAHLGLYNLPTYTCSADAMPDDVHRAYEAGFICYWTKPINVRSELADIEQCVQRSPAHRPPTQGDAC